MNENKIKLKIKPVKRQQHETGSSSMGAKRKRTNSLFQKPNEGEESDKKEAGADYADGKTQAPIRWIT